MLKKSGDAKRPGGLKQAVHRLRTPVEELDREALLAYCDRLDVMPMDQIAARTRVRVGGEVHSVRIVPRAGAPALEVTVSDGRGSTTGVFLGRRKIAGISPGRRLTMEGVVSRQDSRNFIVNPVYTLLG
jgi:hypothetical protein